MPIALQSWDCSLFLQWLFSHTVPRILFRITNQSIYNTFKLILFIVELPWLMANKLGPDFPWDGDIEPIFLATSSSSFRLSLIIEPRYWKLLLTISKLKGPISKLPCVWTCSLIIFVPSYLIWRQVFLRTSKYFLWIYLYNRQMFTELLLTS